MAKIICANPRGNERLYRAEPPIDLLGVAGYLKKNNHDVTFVDFNIIKNPKEVSFAGYDFAFLPLYTLNRFSTYRLAKTIKKNNPNIVIVTGTILCNESHATTMWKQVLDNFKDIDICIVGEAENAILELVEGKNPEEVKDIAYRKDGQTIKNGPRELEKELDK